MPRDYGENMGPSVDRIRGGGLTLRSIVIPHLGERRRPTVLPHVVPFPPLLRGHSAELLKREVLFGIVLWK